MSERKLTKLKQHPSVSIPQMIFHEARPSRKVESGQMRTLDASNCEETERLGKGTETLPQGDDPLKENKNQELVLAVDHRIHRSNDLKLQQKREINRES